MVFLVLRERFSTVQAGLFVNDPEISQGMAEYARRITKESIVEIKAKVVIPEKEVKGCSQKVELIISEVWTINKAAPILPFQIEDAARRCEN
jgi:aspartyl-tRNA synthetase